MGFRPRFASNRGRVASRNAGISRHRCRGLGKGAHRRKTPRLARAWETDALSLFAWRIAGNSSRDERPVTGRGRRDFTWQTRSFGVVSGRAELGLLRSPNVWTSPVCARQRGARVVEKSAAWGDFTRIYARPVG